MSLGRGLNNGHEKAQTSFHQGEQPFQTTELAIQYQRLLTRQVFQPGKGAQKGEILRSQPGGNGLRRTGDPATGDRSPATGRRRRRCPEPPGLTVFERAHIFGFPRLRTLNRGWVVNHIFSKSGLRDSIELTWHIDDMAGKTHLKGL